MQTNIHSNKYHHVTVQSATRPFQSATSEVPMASLECHVALGLVSDIGHVGLVVFVRV